MNRFITLLILLISLTSCAGIRTHWSCAPARGVPCTPVSEIEAMIIESDHGPNIFLGSETDEKPQPDKIGPNGTTPLSPIIHRVWISEKVERGEYHKGHYLYLNPECRS